MPASKTQCHRFNPHIGNKLGLSICLIGTERIGVQEHDFFIWVTLEYSVHKLGRSVIDTSSMTSDQHCYLSG